MPFGNRLVLFAVHNQLNAYLPEHLLLLMLREKLDQEEVARAKQFLGSKACFGGKLWLKVMETEVS